jgi:hypothetical protein
MPTIHLEDIIVAMRQLNLLHLDLIPWPIFDYQPKHIFVLDKILFAQVLTTILHFNHFGWAFWDGIWAYLEMLHTKGPIFKVFRIISGCCYYCSWGYP